MSVMVFGAFALFSFFVGGMVFLPPFGKEFFPRTVSNFSSSRQNDTIFLCNADT